MVGAIDIGGTKIAAGMVDENGQILAMVECATEAQLGFSNALARMIDMLRTTAERASSEITGIGVGCTGPVYPQTGLIGNVDFLPGWEGENLVGGLSQTFGVRVAMENDADAAALGEAFWGAGRGMRHALCVTVGTGIGAGVIIDHRLYRGVGGSHPELGHHVIDASGPQCFCGARGCWEVLASGPALAEWFKANCPQDHPERQISAKRICELASAGDPFARKAVEREAYYLGLGIANLITLFTPEIIVLGGSVMRSAQLFLEGIRKVIRHNCGLVPYQRTELCLASLGPNTPLIGAARAWYHRFAQNGE
jgi:glucokinase